MIQDFSDDPLWMILSTAAYIKETGDYSILDENVPYRNDESLAQPMMHHLQQSFYRVVNNEHPPSSNWVAARSKILSLALSGIW